MATIAAGAPDSALDGEMLRLARIRLHMREVLTRLPDYTCLQTIERSQRAARSRRFQLLDTIRLEVALVQGKELFAWPGAGKFDDRELGQMVGGTIGNGSFALHARAIFMGNAAKIEFAGEGSAEGRTTLRYTYKVPQFVSGYQLRVGDQRGAAGYHGGFEVDAQTLDLLRLEVQTDDIPTNLEIRSASDRMEYARVAIGEKDFLLPKASEMVLTDLEGTDHRNRVAFSGCRQYTGESVISFADPPEGSRAGTVEAPPPVVDVKLPVGLDLVFALETPVKFETAATGDVITGKLTENSKLKGKTIVPKGAVVKGRVLGFQRYRARVDMVRVALRLTEVEFPGAHADVMAIPEDITVPAGWTRAAVDRSGVVSISGSRLELPRGARMVWRIVDEAGKRKE